ncbi:hypothetical protein BUE93_13705 [Chromobacterium amazonense]|uniref:Uncharacterized protein n=1 Tax=Chromobacterium amazonense TaxID=1382803 RepID=A0A2S9X258_9NEIS|nr:hypothetical protein [Chromobacterium amazonense]PRP69746.1 hypothetical protein BUE93_13705 [Chromobacterium amazonense]
MLGFNPSPTPLHQTRDDDFEIADLSLSQQEPMLDKITDAPGFEDGLGRETYRTAEFRSKSEQGIGASLDFIAKHTNPHQIKGMLSNAWSYFSSGALNQNCVICSKAVEKNLAALESGQIDDFWVAESTGQGGLPQNVSPDHYACFSLDPDQPLSSQLLQHSQEGNRNIIMVPVRNKGFAHAMNLVRTDMGAMVIDGQFGQCYNLDAPKDRQNFDKHYGPGKSANVVQIYQTGAAPKAPDIDESKLLEDWEVIDHQDSAPVVRQFAPIQIIDDHFR